MAEFPKQTRSWSVAFSSIACTKAFYPPKTSVEIALVIVCKQSNWLWENSHFSLRSLDNIWFELRLGAFEISQNDFHLVLGEIHVALVTTEESYSSLNYNNLCIRWKWKLCDQKMKRSIRDTFKRKRKGAETCGHLEIIFHIVHSQLIVMSALPRIATNIRKEINRVRLNWTVTSAIETHYIFYIFYFYFIRHILLSRLFNYTSIAQQRKANNKICSMDCIFLLIIWTLELNDHL